MGSTEVWKDIVGYEGLYQISNFGNVRSLGIYKNCYGKGHIRETVFIPKVKIMTLGDNGNGYLYVSLKKDNKRKNRYVHRLVAETFIKNESAKGYVNHLDYNTKNNHVSNLEWCTQKENIEYSRCNFARQHFCNTSTGERYITRKKNRNLYRVCLKRANVDKCFKTLEKAVAFRNEVLNEINYSI